MKPEINFPYVADKNSEKRQAAERKYTNTGTAETVFLCVNILMCIIGWVVTVGAIGYVAVKIFL